jgi:hypothetical protein
MKRKAALTMIAKVYCAWLASKFPPGGKPQVYLLEARLLVIIEMLPVSQPGEPPVDYPGSPNVIGEAGSFSIDNIRNALEWMFSAIPDAYGSEDWAKIWAFTARESALPRIEEIYERILRPINTLDSGEMSAAMSG